MPFRSQVIKSHCQKAKIQKAQIPTKGTEGSCHVDVLNKEMTTL